MKILMMIVSLYCLALFGAEIKVVGAEAKTATASIPPIVAKFDKLRKNPNYTKPTEQGVEQIILNVPVSTDTFDKTTVELPNGFDLSVTCIVHNDSKDFIYGITLPIVSGEHTLSFKFKGIPMATLNKLTNYTCVTSLTVNNKPEASISEVFDLELFENPVLAVEGNL